MTAEGRHPLDGGGAPAWAVAWGEDRFGAFAVLVVGPPDKPVEQRMRWIPPGAFLMGSPKTERWRYGDEGPQHEVILSRGFWLGDTPVTQAMWMAVVGKNPSRFRREPDGLERPVEQVSWDDCQVFIEKINARVAGLEARLPTEAEWERACRAKTTGATWVGDVPGTRVAVALDAIAWYDGNSGEATHPVGRKAPNPYGLYDMLGNVWEWCSDVAERFGLQYVRSPRSVDPLGTGVSPLRFHRGGAWDCDAGYVRAAYRNADSRGARRSYLGFRLAANHRAQ